ncbi:hypothetical protein BN2497_8219 [Janthinobacterium sp. CG23_2]|nr:hypothetical protein BN2497_8219 [Janthinobacterium sp. CG23_2]CUU30507.1 hypothetical protein BN3177_8219 [Janthinobacterium sp. CG23_2]
MHGFLVRWRVVNTAPTGAERNIVCHSAAPFAKEIARF